jgi:hypothetical protein
VCFLIKLHRTYEKSLEGFQQIYYINNAPNKLITEKKEEEFAKD